MTKHTEPTVWICCQKCGHERRINRGDLTSGRWKSETCPVCRPDRDDETNRKGQGSRQVKARQRHALRLKRSGMSDAEIAKVLDFRSPAGARYAAEVGRRREIDRRREAHRREQQ